MKLLTLLLLSTSLFGQTIQDRVKTFDSPKQYKIEYDKFQKATTVTVDAPVKSTKKPSGFVSMSLQPMTAFVRIPDSGEPYFALWFSARSRFFNQPTLRLLLDGELMERESDEIETSVFYTFSPAEFRKILSAKSVVMQLVSFEGRFDEQTMRKLRNLSSLVN